MTETTILLLLALAGALPPNATDSTGAPATRTSAAVDVKERTSGIVRVSDKGAVGDGVADDTSAIQSAIASAQAARRDIDFGDSTKVYKITTVSIGPTNGVRLLGRGATIQTSEAVAIRFVEDSSDVVFSGLRFVSTSRARGGVLGLVTSIGVHLRNIKVDDCDFTAPTAEANAIKLDVSSPGSLKDLSITRSQFVNVGRMAIEIINHTFDGVPRYEHVRILGNRFDGLGLASKWGEAVSLSGLGNVSVIAGNTIENARTIALELVNSNDAVITGNALRNLAAECQPFYVGKSPALPKITGLTFTANTIDGFSGMFQPTNLSGATIANNVLRGSGKVSFESCDRIALTGNVFEVSNQILFLSVANSTFSGNHFSTDGDKPGHYPILSGCRSNVISGTTFMSKRSHGLLVDRASTNNIFTGCLFSNEGAVEPLSTLRFSGSSVTGNVVTASSFRRVRDGFAWDQTSDASGNLVALPKADGSRSIAPTSGPSFSVDAATGRVFDITATDGHAFSIRNPINGTPGQEIAIRIRNASGGNLGAVTWDSAYRLSDWKQPVKGRNRAVTFAYDGTTWVEVSRTPADIPN